MSKIYIDVLYWLNVVYNSTDLPTDQKSVDLPVAEYGHYGKQCHVISYARKLLQVVTDMLTSSKLMYTCHKFAKKNI